MKLSPAGDRALLLTLGDVTAAELHATRASVRAVNGVVACVPGHSSLLVVFEGRPDEAAVSAAAVNTCSLASGGTARHVRIALGGEDLDEFLARTGVTRAELERRLDGMTLTARYLGFRGGFAYLDGWPAEWSMPRRATSRPVRRGAFAIAGSVAAFYPVDTPGGWNILGYTDGELRFAAGDEIVLEVVTTQSSSPSGAPSRRQTGEAGRRPDEGNRDRAYLENVEIISAPLATVVTAPDWSRAEHGFSPGGPFDEELARLANAAVGNDRGAPLLECAMVWPKLRTTRALVFAGPDGMVRETAEGRIEGGLRGYVAVGDARTEVTPLRRVDRSVIRCIAGPHESAIRELTCEVTPQLDRVGIRLRPLTTIAVPGAADLPSCGMQFGTMQLHPDGSVVVMGPDHPVTGGYLQPMTVISGERWKLAQLSPGERVRFVADQSP